MRTTAGLLALLLMPLAAAAEPLPELRYTISASESPIRVLAVEIALEGEHPGDWSSTGDAEGAALIGAVTALDAKGKSRRLLPDGEGTWTIPPGTVTLRFECQLKEGGWVDTTNVSRVGESLRLEKRGFLTDP